ncbi:MAG TPA: O-antigen ligase family protein, partial [Armatimonadota bacterium]
MCSSTANGESLSTATSNLAQPLAKIRRFARRIIYLLLFIAPLLYAPGLPLANPFDTGRRLFLLLCTGLLCACLLQSWEQCKQFTLRKHVLDIPVLLFSLAILVTGFTSAYPWISLFGPVWSKDGLPLLGSCLVLYFAIKEFIVDPREISFALNITVFSGGLVALIGLTEYFGILNFHLPYSQYRLMSTLGNPMFTGTYLATLIPLGFGLIFACPHPRLKLWLDASTLVMLVALLFTLTRGAWVAVCCAFLLMSVLVICQRKRLFPSPASVWGLWIRFAIYAFVLVIMLTAQSRLSVKSAESLAVQSRLSSMTHLQSENTVTDRLLAIKGGVRMFLARPLFGWGLGTSSFVMPEFRPVGSQSRYAIQSYPHCLPVQIAAETGILGLLPYLLLLVLLFYTAYKITCRDGEFAWLGIGLLGLFTANFVASLGAVDDAETLMLFWAMLGITASLQAKEAVLSTTSEAKAMPAFGRYLCHYGALLALLLTILTVSAQTAASYFQYRAVYRLDRAQALITTDTKRAADLSFAAIGDLFRAIDLTPLPTLHTKHLLLAGDTMSWRLLAQAYITQTHIFT